MFIRAGRCFHDLLASSQRTLPIPLLHALLPIKFLIATYHTFQDGNKSSLCLLSPDALDRAGRGAMYQPDVPQIPERLSFDRFATLNGIWACSTVPMLGVSPQSRLHSCRLP